MTLKKHTFEDHEYIQLIRNGDTRCFETLYLRYFQALCAFACQYVSYPEAEEIVQDALIWIWENRQKLLPQSSLKSLLYTIVRNKALNLISQSQTRSRIIEEIRLRDEETIYDPSFCTDKELERLYENALSHITPDFRRTFELNRMEGFTHREIAQKLNISEQTVNYRICKTLTLLKTAFKDYLL